MSSFLKTLKNKILLKITKNGQISEIKKTSHQGYQDCKFELAINIQYQKKSMSTSGILIVYTPGTPKTVKQNVKKLAQSSPKYFKEKLLSNEHCLDLIKYFKLCNFESFYESPFLLKCVCSISFPCLKILYLEKVGLTSFEPLHWIEAPHLAVLHLMENNVVNVKSLAKTKFGFIAKMEIDRIVDHAQMNHLARMKLKPNTEVNNQSKERTLQQNNNQNLTSLIEFMFKMESNNFTVDPKKNIRNVETLLIRASQRVKRTEGKKGENKEVHWDG